MWRRPTVALVVLLALILVPFFIWEEPIEQWTRSNLRDGRPTGVVAATVVLLLAADVALPVPSSIVSTSGAYLLGFGVGLAASWTGMTLGCIAGYLVGRYAGRTLLRRLLSDVEFNRSAARFAERGDWVLAMSRAVPVLAEASVMAAGATRRPFARFVAVCSLANFGISLVYAAAGGLSLRVDSFLVAFACALIVPWIAMRLFRVRKLRANR